METTSVGDKVGESALKVLNAAVTGRWSSDIGPDPGPSNTSRGLAQRAGAERDDVAADVEEQLFRFGRTLDSEPRLAMLLGDHSAPARRGASNCCASVARLAAVSTGLLRRCFRQTVELLHGARADEAVLDLAELAVARRGEVVAHVGAAADLSDAQRRPADRGAHAHLWPYRSRFSCTQIRNCWAA